ncbi:MAG: hypothetical protein WAN26_10285, partial [Steroidobacteraceae bacterium]
MTPKFTVFQVALDTPVRRLFDYLPPVTFVPGAILPGMRVRVPFGRRRLVGVVMGVADTSDVGPERLKAVLEVLDRQPLLDEAALALIAWAAEYYHHPIGEVVASALPRALRLGAPIAALEERWTATAQGVAAPAAGELQRAPRQRALLEFLITRGGASAATLNEQLRSWRDAARALAARGLITSVEVPAERAEPPA